MSSISVLSPMKALILVSLYDDRFNPLGMLPIFPGITSDGESASEPPKPVQKRQPMNQRNRVLRHAW